MPDAGFFVAGHRRPALWPCKDIAQAEHHPNAVPAMNNKLDEQQRATRFASKQDRERDAATAMKEYEAEKAAVLARTAKLRAIRLAKEAVTQADDQAAKVEADKVAATKADKIAAAKADKVAATKADKIAAAKTVTKKPSAIKAVAKKPRAAATKTKTPKA
jgi:colicin import membrane protein